jgi:hypothetical protein
LLQWQVFWLGPHQMSLPAGFVALGSGMKHLAILPAGRAGEPYSYGDSAGLAPDFPFNSAHAVAQAKTNYAANVRGKAFGGIAYY